MRNSEFLKIRPAKKCSPDKIRALKSILSADSRELSILNRFLNFLFFFDNFQYTGKLDKYFIFSENSLFSLILPLWHFGGLGFEFGTSNRSRTVDQNLVNKQSLEIFRSVKTLRKYYFPLQKRSIPKKNRRPRPFSKNIYKNIYRKIFIESEKYTYGARANAEHVYRY